MVMELGPPLSKSFTNISRFYVPTDSEHKFHKAGNLVTHRIQTRDPWLRTTDWATTEWGFPWWRKLAVQLIMGSLQNFLYLSKKSWNKPGDILLPWNCGSVLKSSTHNPEKHQSPIEQKPTNNGLIIYKHSARSKLHNIAPEKTKRKLPRPWGGTRKFLTHLTPSFP